MDIHHHTFLTGQRSRLNIFIITIEKHVLPMLVVPFSARRPELSLHEAVLLIDDLTLGISIGVVTNSVLYGPGITPYMSCSTERGGKLSVSPQGPSPDAKAMTTTPDR